jgi:hypothetical protein
VREGITLLCDGLVAPLLCIERHFLVAIGRAYYQCGGSGTVRVPMFSVLRDFDAPEILTIVSATAFAVIGVAYFFWIVQ